MTMEWNDEDGNVFGDGNGGGGGGVDSSKSRFIPRAMAFNIRLSTITCCLNAYGLVQL